MVSRPFSRLSGLKATSFDMVSLVFVVVGVVSWVRFANLLRSQSGTLVRTESLLNSVGFLFIASQLTTVGAAFYAYSFATRSGTFGKSAARLWGPRTRPLDMLSIALVAVGVVSWIRFLDLLKSQTGTFVQTEPFLNSLGFFFIASQLTTVGAAFYTYSLATRRVSEFEKHVETAVDSIDTYLTGRDGASAKSALTLDVRSLRERSSPRLPGIYLLALIEALGLLLMYGWLAAEFESNAFMQDWASKNAPWVFYVLNEYLLLPIGVLLGFLLLRLWSRRKPPVIH